MFLNVRAHPRKTRSKIIVLHFKLSSCSACCIVLYCIVLYCTVLCCIVLYCVVLYCIVLYCILSSGWLPGIWILCADVFEHKRCSETSTHTIQAPGNYPKERIQQNYISVYFIYQTERQFRLHVGLTDRKVSGWILYIAENSDASIITTLFFPLLINRYNDWLLPLLRQFLLIPNTIYKLKDLKTNCPILCSTGIPSLLGDL
jgi:hypothetical protein